jgi:hypothetical protein
MSERMKTRGSKTAEQEANVKSKSEDSGRKVKNSNMFEDQGSKATRNYKSETSGSKSSEAELLGSKLTNFTTVVKQLANNFSEVKKPVESLFSLLLLRSELRDFNAVSDTLKLKWSI